MHVRTVVAATAIWAIGAWLRLQGLNAMEFKADERISLELAIQLLTDHPWSSAAAWPSHGLISSNGIGNAPLFIWIVGLLWAITHHPIGVTALIAATNAVCLIPLWFWAARRMDEPRALLTLAIAAVSPFAVLFSRKIWPVDLLFPGLLAVLWSIEWIREGRHWRAIALGGIGVLFITQLHQSGIVTGPLLFVAIAIQLVVDARRGVIAPLSRPSRGELAAIAIVVAANLFFWWTYLPYLATLPGDVLAARPRAADFSPQLLLNVISEIVPRHVRSPFWDEHNLFTVDPLRRAVYSTSLALGIPLAAYGVWRWLRAPLTLPVVGIWWWIVIVAFALARIPSHEYYVLAIMPLPIALAAGAFDGRLPRWSVRALLVWRWTYVASLLALTVVTGAWLAGRGGSRADYGVTFEIQEAQARTLLARARGDVAIFNSGRAEIAAAESVEIQCHKASWEVMWIARWLDPQSPAKFDAFEICDGWMSQGQDVVYRWAIRRAP